jgi:protein-disulfide isomerase
MGRSHSLRLKVFIVELNAHDDQTLNVIPPVADDPAESLHNLINNTTYPAASNTANQPVITIQRATLNYIVIGVVFLVIGAIVGMVAYERFSGGLSEDTLRRVVNAAIEANRTQTQAMITEALAGVGGNTQVAQDPNRRYEVTFEGNPSRGAAEPVVRIVGFEDFRCGYCKRFNDQTVQQILTTYGDQVQFVFRDYPILGQESLESALAGACANDQNAFWEFHDRFYANQSNLTRDAFIAYATELNLDLETFTTCYDTRQHEQAIYADFVEGQSLGVGGTPTFFVNGRILVGAQPYEAFAAMIEEEIADAQTSAAPESAS